MKNAIARLESLSIPIPEAIGFDYGVSASTIGKVKRHETWTHI